MDKKTKKILILLVALIIVLILVIATLTVFLPLFIHQIASSRQPVEVTITDAYLKEATYGEGNTLFINVTFRNDGTKYETVSLPAIITDSGRSLDCDFISIDKEIESTSAMIRIPANNVVNTTISTWDTNYSCECLNESEKPITFEYQLGSGVMAAPTVMRLDIPNDVINDL